MPRREELDRRIAGSRILGEALRRGIEAIAWIVDERGLGGGNERDGLAWVLPLDKLWESYVESVYRREAADTGGEVRVGRLGETLFPLNWSDPTHRTLGHLVPDMVIRRGRYVQVVDAKYKAHLAEVDDMGWRRFEEETREAHRADLHQILAYASLYEAEEITATLVYPLRYSTYRTLREQHRERSFAELLHGGRRIRLELRGLPFGMKDSSWE
jgi:5-methylcytosine-specific restriction endonuclease McrBC regulatory subunit McrC